jgi:hypothetical protein
MVEEQDLDARSAHPRPKDEVFRALQQARDYRQAQTPALSPVHP